MHNTCSDIVIVRQFTWMYYRIHVHVRNGYNLESPLTLYGEGWNVSRWPLISSLGIHISCRNQYILLLFQQTNPFFSKTKSSIFGTLVGQILHLRLEAGEVLFAKRHLVNWQNRPIEMQLMLESQYFPANPLSEERKLHCAPFLSCFAEKCQIRFLMNILSYFLTVSCNDWKDTEVA